MKRLLVMAALIAGSGNAQAGVMCSVFGHGCIQVWNDAVLECNRDYLFGQVHVCEVIVCQKIAHHPEFCDGIDNLWHGCAVSATDESSLRQCKGATY